MVDVDTFLTTLDVMAGVEHNEQTPGTPVRPCEDSIDAARC
jgi:hypothetical protein